MRDRLTVAALAVLVVAGGLLVNHADRAWPATRPFVTAGEQGRPAALWPGSVTVHSARAARGLADGYGGSLTTGGVWVAVDLSVTGGDRPLDVGAFQLVDGEGRSYDATRRLSPNAPGTAQPSSPVRAEVIFEVPESTLGALTLRASTLAVPQLSAVAEVPVRLAGAVGAELEPRPTTLETP
ncbi:hypothetical protein [Georgenia daeguensis]|uniref:hypothetical protein n=1 Tax=Georgenia daeguensis TaxID=908355 RepID=UPI0031EDEFA2